MNHETQNIYFIGDLHVGHKNVIKYDNRPFSDIHEMNECLINNWNSVISDTDIVYYMGDLSLCGSDMTKWFVSQLNGVINFIIGNHDNIKNIKNLNRFDKIYEYGTEVNIKDDNDSTKRSGGYQRIVLSHYPFLSWNGCNHNSWHLHAHCHGNLIKSNPDFYKRKVIDVGAPCIDYTPISYNEIKDIMLSKGTVEKY